MAAAQAGASSNTLTSLSLARFCSTAALARAGSCGVSVKMAMASSGRRQRGYAHPAAQCAAGVHHSPWRFHVGFRPLRRSRRVGLRVAAIAIDAPGRPAMGATTCHSASVTKR